MHPQLLSVLTVFLTLLAGPLLCLPGVKCQQAASNTSAWNAPPGGDLALNNFKYQEGNTASLVRQWHMPVHVQHTAARRATAQP